MLEFLNRPGRGADFRCGFAFAPDVPLRLKATQGGVHTRRWMRGRLGTRLATMVVRDCIGYSLRFCAANGIDKHVICGGTQDARFV